jgi:hypothetical protein
VSPGDADQATSGVTILERLNRQAKRDPHSLSQLSLYQQPLSELSVCLASLNQQPLSKLTGRQQMPSRPEGLAALRNPPTPSRDQPSLKDNEAEFTQ